MSSRNVSRFLASAVLAFAVFATPGGVYAASKVALGKKLFLTNCSSCHGERGDGKGPAAASMQTKPRNFIDGMWLSGTSAEDLVQIMSSGIPASGMPSFQALPESERRAIAAFIKTLKK
jgi:mono/diheme cytochrome c family protein